MMGCLHPLISIVGSAIIVVCIGGGSFHAILLTVYKMICFPLSFQVLLRTNMSYITCNLNGQLQQKVQV